MPTCNSVLTAGKVIQNGIVSSGIIYKYFLNLRIAGLEFEAEVVRMLSKLTKPPRTGKMPVGSGDDKSLNQKKPSESIAGFTL